MIRRKKYTPKALKDSPEQIKLKVNQHKNN